MSDQTIPSLEYLLTHRRWVQGVARRLLRDEHAAEDLAQEAWMRAMRSPPDPERDPKPWLRRVLKNLASNVRRGEGRRLAHETAWRESREERSPADLVAEAEQHTRLVGLLMDLEDPFKTVLVLRFYEGLGPKEIAARLGIPVGTVHSRIARAVERLKTRLDEEENGNRQAWIAGLLPLARLDLHAPAAAATATTTSLAGILAMTLSKPKIALLTVLLVGCLTYGGIWLASDSRGQEPDPEDGPELIALDRGPTLKGKGSPLIADAGTGFGSRPARTSDPAADAGRIVRGRVLDAKGLPVADAEVFALPEESPGLDDELDAPRYGRTLTGEDGTFAVRLLDNARAGRLLAYAEGHMAGSILLDETGSGEDIEILLGAPWRFRVRVTDRDGAWPAGCEIDVVDYADDSLERAVDPKRQEAYVEFAAPERGNAHEVILNRAGRVWVFVTVPDGLAAVPQMVELRQPTEEVSIRVLRSGALTVRLLDATTGQELAADARITGWMGRKEEDLTVWSFGYIGPRHQLASRIAPQRYELEFDAIGYEPWKGEIAFQAEGEAKTLDIRLEPRRTGTSEGRLLLRVLADKTSSDALLALARMHSEMSPKTNRQRLYARMREGDLEAWNERWGTSGGWASLHPTPQEDGTLEIQESIYPLEKAGMPAGTYDLYVAERGTGRAAYVSGIRVFGDHGNRYEVRLEPGTMFWTRDVLPGDDVYTDLEVRTAETGSLPLLWLEHDGSQVFCLPNHMEYLLQVPRKAIRLGPFPAAAVEVRAVDGNGQARIRTVRGAGEIVAR